MAAFEGVEEKSTRAEVVFDRIKRNPIISAAIALGTIVITVSSCTNAAKNLWSSCRHSCSLVR